MKGKNHCHWLLLGSAELCGRSCLRDHCKIHLPRLCKGGGTYACRSYEVGVKTDLALCKPCGSAVYYQRVVYAQKRLIRDEFLRLAAVNLE